MRSSCSCNATDSTATSIPSIAFMAEVRLWHPGMAVTAVQVQRKHAQQQQQVMPEGAAG
jgi:hypothetical protein